MEFQWTMKWFIFAFIMLCAVASVIGSMVRNPGHANCGSGQYQVEQCSDEG